jgi:glycosyltransferase involved in cell wall biosynthesis
MQDDVLSRVIFSPGRLALDLAAGFPEANIEPVLFTPGPVTTAAENITADLTLFKAELAGRGDDFLDLLKKHPLTFVTLARQVQAELIARAYEMANGDELDVVHIYTNEEDIALPFARFCHKPVVFTHHDPFNFLISHKNVFPKYAALNWISISMAQRAGMPATTNWVGNVYHGVDAQAFTPHFQSDGTYVAYLGRIIEPKGVQLAIEAVRSYNQTHARSLKLKIAGKHYAGQKKDGYWQEHILPNLDGDAIEYVGFLDGPAKAQFLAGAQALMVPSIFAEPFGVVAIEALACATPVIALDSGALPEVIDDGVTGFVVPKIYRHEKLDIEATARALAVCFDRTMVLDRRACRMAFEQRFTLQHMCQEYAAVYRNVSRG